MKNKIYQKAVWLLLLLPFFQSCSKGTTDSDGNDRATFSGWFNGSEVVDIEKLHNNMAEEMLDSTGVKEFLMELELSPELKEPYLSFYKERDYQPAWVDEDGLTDNGKELLQAVKESPEQGLNPEDYKLQYLYHLKKKTEKEDAAIESFSKLEKEFTAAYLKYADHVLRGRLNPEKLDALWKTNQREKDLAVHLQQALEEEEVAASLQALEPTYKGYHDLKTALSTYEEIEKETKDWKPLPADLVLKPGDSSEHVARLSKMLVLLGDLEEGQEEEQVYSESLAAALARFQERHGLEPDSIVAENTLAMVNVPVKKRVEQLKLNLERFRWLPEQPEGRHVVVNVPEYKVFVYEGKDSTLSMRVIVGKAYESTTPIFTDSMEYIAFSPTWTVPVSIATEEMLPRLKEDPSYLRDRNFKLYESWEEDAPEVDSERVNWRKVDADDFPYRIVQNPGPNNSLGKVKFMFPNTMDIYLHDTPADYLFKRNERDLSHGCIRLEKPAEFAQYLLQEQNVSLGEIEQNMNLPEPLNTVLPEKVPVFIEYRTAWMGPEGKVHFREDIYGHDRKQMDKLSEAMASAN